MFQPIISKIKHSNGKRVIKKHCCFRSSAKHRSHWLSFDSTDDL